MNVIQDHRMAPALSQEELHLANFDASEYILENELQTLTENDYIYKTECYYLIKFEKIFGTLYIKQDCLVFEPDADSDQNDTLSFKLTSRSEKSNYAIEDFTCTMDYLDMVEVQQLQLINEKAIVSQNDFIRDAYKFDTFLQVGLSTINGITLLKEPGTDNQGAVIDKKKESALLERNELPIANIFFKIHHLEKVPEGQVPKVLTNQY